MVCGRVFGIRQRVQRFIGANDGRNLKALKTLGVEHVAGVEINGQAFAQLKKVADEATQGSFLDMGEWHKQYDLSFTKGMLIHVPPLDLPDAYDVLYKASRRYILLGEYYSVKIESVAYYDADLTWKGPYAEDMLKRYPDLKLLDYGFISRLDEHPEDDVTFFLMERQ